MGEKKDKIRSETKEQLKKRTELFTKYVEPHTNLIYKICLAFTKSSNDVQDNYQECLINFFRYIHTYNSDRQLSTWIHIVTKRRVLDLERQRKRGGEFSYIDPEKLENEFVTSEEDESLEITPQNYKELLTDEVIEALDSLNPIYRDTFLEKQAGYKLKEIMERAHSRGTLKNKNIETIKSRLFLARRHLQKHLKHFKNFNE